MKKGFSLIEVVLSLGLFTLSASLIIGAFVAVSRIKSTTADIREAQQKSRIAIEMITRLSRQAEKVIVTNEGKDLELHFNLNNENEAMRAIFRLKDNGIFYGDCSGGISCPITEGDKINLFEGLTLDYESRFKRIIDIPLQLDVKISGSYGAPGAQDENENKIELKTLVILEGVR